MSQAMFSAQTKKNIKLFGIGLAALLIWMALSAALLYSMYPLLGSILEYASLVDFPYVAGLLATLAITFVNMGVAVMYGALGVLRKCFNREPSEAENNTSILIRPVSFSKVASLSVWGTLTAFSSITVFLFASLSSAYAATAVASLFPFIALGGIGLSIAAVLYGAIDGLRMPVKKSETEIASEIKKQHGSTFTISTQLDVSPAPSLANDSNQTEKSYQVQVKNVEVKVESPKPDTNPVSRMRVA